VLGKPTDKQCCFASIFFMTLWHFFQDEEDVKAIARLYADMGESYVDLIAAGKFHGLC